MQQISVLIVKIATFVKVNYIFVKMSKLLKSIFFQAFLIVSLGASAKTYYVAPSGGSDYNPGTISQPWATWQKAFKTAIAGDTVYFRGGVWYLTSHSDRPTINPDAGIGNSGIVGSLIHFLNYPGETPILDGSRLPAKPYNPPLDADGDEDWVVGVDISWANFLHFRGLTVRNFYQHRNYVHVTGINFGGCTNLILENMVAHHISGRGFSIQNNTFSQTPSGFDAHVSYDSTWVINCDVYDCVDSLRENDHGGGYGDWADGFAVTNQHNSTTHERGYMEFSGCRAIRCSDDAWNAGGSGFLYIHNCWAIHAGHCNGVINPQGVVMDGDGGGFKVMPIEEYYMDDNFVQRIQVNNIAAFNYLFGFGENNSYGPSVNQKVYNNTAFKNDRGFSVHKTADEYGPHLTNDYRNNLAYGNYYADMNYGQGGYAVIDTYNTWNAETRVNVTNDDFQLIDSAQVYAQLTAPRNEDGSLPEITALKLAANSDLIDKGVNVGLAFSGSAPDLGYSEYGTQSGSPPEPTLVTVLIQNASPEILEMTYSLTLANIIPPTSAFTVKVNTVIRTVNSVAISGTKVTLTVASPVAYGDVVTVAYTKPSANQLQTPDGGQAETLATRNVTNNVIASVPIFTSAVIQNTTPTKLEMTYSLILANIIPPTSAFTVKVNTVTRTVNSVAVSGTKVTLTLASPVIYGDAITVSYTKPSASPLQTSNGGQASTIPAQDVINNCSETPNHPPVVIISSPTKSNAYYAPATIIIDATASDSDGIISKVEFYNGQTKLGEVISSPYSFTWKDVPEGTYLISATATDNKNARTVSSSVTVVVNKAAPIVNQLPVVNIKNPHKGKKFRKNEPIILEAEASDPDGTISKIEFKSGDVILAELTEAPYIFNWQNADTGNFIVTAIATDNLGAVSQSPEVDFAVFEVKVPGLTIVSLYPNPNDGKFRVVMAEAIDSERLYTIYNVSGQALHYEKRDGQEITADFNLIELPAGTYILAVSAAREIIDARKFIKR